ncbi:hypothetical protein B0H17DRAFT_1150164 [Mycena rosella]|uniref:Uncharacterized protein n=1 Tax=Mycena rosella TaxID=1033263 RepID=A0AAD7FQ60_MYCRO|nr:hypothetical protein B0H17DRAFT_1150164 [Mycena rosella]
MASWKVQLQELAGSQLENSWGPDFLEDSKHLSIPAACSRETFRTCGGSHIEPSLMRKVDLGRVPWHRSHETWIISCRNWQNQAWDTIPARHALMHLKTLRGHVVRENQAGTAHLRRIEYLEAETPTLCYGEAAIAECGRCRADAPNPPANGYRALPPFEDVAVPR